jgi:xanthine dehydrogenase accessory factor
MTNIYLDILEQQAINSPLVLATVVRTHGSTPQKTGSSALFCKKGLIAGTVGGGIVEAKTMEAALESIKSRQSSLLRINLANDISNKEEAICGGDITILIDANLQNYTSVFSELKESLEKRIPGVIITMVNPFSEKSIMVNRYWISAVSKPVIPESFMEKIGPEADRMLSAGDPSAFCELELEIPGEEPSSLFFLEPVFPLPELIIAGAGHIGKALAHLGSMLGFRVTVIDDRPEFANSQNIPDAQRIIVDDVGKAMADIEKNRDTFVVIVTRGHKDDSLALRPCIGTGLAYTGMIGSRKKVAAMRNDFIANGWATEEEWAKIYAPVGIDIKSQTVEEIAVSIAAQLVLVKNSPKTEDRRIEGERGRKGEREKQNPKLLASVALAKEARNPKPETRNFEL